MDQDEGQRILAEVGESGNLALPKHWFDIRHVTHYDGSMIKTLADRDTQQLYVTGKSRRLPPDLSKRALGRLEIVPTHPGEMLREDFMPDYGLTPGALASALGVSRQSLYELLREERAVTPLMALRLSRLFGNSPAFWLNAQQARDLWESEERNHDELRRIERLLVAA